MQDATFGKMPPRRASETTPGHATPLTPSSKSTRPQASHLGSKENNGPAWVCSFEDPHTVIIHFVDPRGTGFPSPDDKQNWQCHFACDSIRNLFTGYSFPSTLRQQFETGDNSEWPEGHARSGPVHQVHITTLIGCGLPRSIQQGAGHGNHYVPF